MKIKLEELRAAFAVLDAVSASPAFESSLFVRFHNEKGKLSLSMTGTLWSHMALKGEGTWEWFVERRLLKAFLKTASGDVDLELKDKYLLLRAGQQLKVPAHVAIGGYESAWKPKSEFDLTDDHRKLLPTMSRYRTDLAGMEYVNAIRFAPGFGVLGTDTIFIALEQDSTLKGDLLMPPEIAELALNYPQAKIGFDGSGVGLVFPNGFVYQPLNDELSRYPLEKIKGVASGMMKSKPQATLLVDDLHSSLSAMKEFLLEQSVDKANVTPDKGRVVLSIIVGGSKIQRGVPLQSGAVTGNPGWVIERMLPWLSHIKSVAPDAELDYIAQADMSAFRYKMVIIIFANV